LKWELLTAFSGTFGVASLRGRGRRSKVKADSGGNQRNTWVGGG
jgi:hypothetical protein